MSELNDYFQQDHEAYMKTLHLNAVGHLCFECRRSLEAEQMITISMLGPLPIYHHSTCVYPEDEVQIIKEKAEQNGGVYTT